MANDHAGEKELGMETWKDVAVEFWKHFQDPVLISGVIWGVLVGLPLSLWVYLKPTGRFGTTAEGRPWLRVIGQ